MKNQTALFISCIMVVLFTGGNTFLSVFVLGLYARMGPVEHVVVHLQFPIRLS